MSKLLVSLALTAIVFGLGVYIFQGGGGVHSAVRDGHSSILDAVRGFDYVSE